MIVALVDYVTFSVKEIYDPDAFALNMFGDIDWEHRNGKNGYSDCLYYNGMKFYRRKSSPGFEVCVDMSGTGCRAFESLMGDRLEWSGYLYDLQQRFDVHFSRIDIALDCTEKWLPSVKKLQEYICENKYVSKSRCKMGTIWDEEGIYFGSKSSDVRLRIYNKALERKDVTGHWLRFEFQLRNKSAEKFLKEYHSRGNLGHCIKSCLNNWVRFTTKQNQGINTNRLVNTQWWNRLMSGAEKISFFERPGFEYNLSRLEKYLLTQVAPSLVTYMKCKGGDMTKLLELGELKLNSLQLDLIKQFMPDE